jgi:thioredoxin 1
MEVLHPTDEEFLVILQQYPIVVADFCANWCTPCTILSTTIDRLSEEYGDKIAVVKIDVDAYGALARNYKVHSIPTVLIFRNAKFQAQIIGVTKKKDYEKLIEEALAEKE